MPNQISQLALPETGFLREKQVLAVFPVGRSTWWEGVRTGEYPQSYKLSKRCTAWKAEDIRKLIESLGVKSDEAADNDDQPGGGGDQDES